MQRHRTSNIEHRTLNETDDCVWLLRDVHGDRKYDLENGLLEFASAINDLSERLPDTRAGNHVAGQLLRSGTSPFSNHGEAESAESRLVQRKKWTMDDTTLLFVLGESEELIRIFMSSIRTARQNALKKKPVEPV